MNNEEVHYCSRCILPSTKPDLSFDDNGLCHACQNYDARPSIDWDLREEELKAILEKHKSQNNSNYDCLIPVSGGKDSTFQIIKMLEYGMNPLCVTATTDKLSEIGRRNIEVAKNLGVDYIEVSMNPVVRRKINKIALNQVGDIGWPEHVTIFTVPIRIAVQMKIPLLIWGENSQNEYGGPAASADRSVLTREWLSEFGGMNGLRVSDLVGQEGIEEKHLIQYTYPTDEELDSVGVTGLFLGHYIPWDGHNNALVAQAHGFETWPTVVEGSMVNYENLDNLQMRVHDYFKYLKFGYGRVTDWAGVHIRRGRINRKEAFLFAEKYAGKFPDKYLGVPLSEILKDIDMTLDEFVDVCDRFTNKKLFKCDRHGNLVKDRHGNLIKLF